MTAILLPRHELHSDAWHEARRSRIGASEMAAVLGLSPWQSPFSLWHLKAGTIQPDGGNAHTEWGQRLEPVVAEKFMEEHHDEFNEWSSQGDSFASFERPWQAASPDLGLIRRYDGTESFCEIKTAARADAWYDGVPIYYRIQVLQTMDVLGVDRAYLAALISGSTYREYVIEMDDEAKADLAIMRSAGEQFMASLAAGEAPDIDSSYATFQTIRRMHPDIELDAEVEVSRDVAEAYLAANQASSEAEKAQRLARTDVARHLKRAQYATCEGVRIARRQPARDGGAPVLVSTRRHLPAKENAA